MTLASNFRDIWGGGVGGEDCLFCFYKVASLSSHRMIFLCNTASPFGEEILEKIHVNIHTNLHREVYDLNAAIPVESLQ